MANGVLGGAPPGLQGWLLADEMRARRQAQQLGGLQGILGLQGALSQQRFAEQTQPLQLELMRAQLQNAQNPAPVLKDMGGSIGIFHPRTFQQLGVIPKSATPGEQLRETTARETSVLNPAVVAAKKDIAGAGKPSVDVRVEQKTGESFAKEIGPMMTESRAAAAGAVGAVDTAQRIKGAIAQGNVTLGPTATLRNKADQISQLMGVAGNTTSERLVNTRNVIRGLSQFAVAARKQLKGQGQVSDYEGKLIQRAEAGEIDDFTLPELRDFVGVTERLAQKTYAEHERLLGVMKADPRLSGFVPFYAAPALPGSGQKRIKRTGTYQGKKVVEYEDGTIETQ